MRQLFFLFFHGPFFLLAAAFNNQVEFFPPA